MKRITFLSALTALAIFPGIIYAQSNCNPTTAQAELEINNIRTTILVGGDMWWDLNNPKYEVPKGSGKHSLYSGALWIGGIDGGGNIKVAAQTYRQTGSDFWGGPLDTTSTTITNEKCLAYDRLWKVTRQEVENFIENPSSVTNAIKNWPGNGDALSNEGQFLAPFYDNNGDGIYNSNGGDYPGYNISGEYPTIPGYKKSTCNDYLFGDQTIWWVFNDVGNIHNETGSEPIGLEIRAQAFAFQTNDEINNMTFYKYQIINRSSLSLNNAYFGQWVDPDLGYSDDDYVGCDVARGLGFCYNGDTDDETASGYGLQPPAIGVDFFQGPVADIGDLIDNDRDGCVDCTFIEDTNGVIVSVPETILREQIIMSKFVYYDNVNNAPNGNPGPVTDYYNYLKGFWLDNQQISFGGDGRNANAPVTNFMFPGDTDPDFPGQNWSEVSEGNPTGDRRFLQSAGEFTLLPGAVNYVTTGVVWARAQQGDLLASVELVKIADDKAQALFDNCFKLLDGPNAPDLAVRELDKTIILSLENTYNEKVELYHERDVTIAGVDDSLTFFDFQGYQIFQLKDASVTLSDFGNSDKIRLLAQCDIQDSVAQLVNFNYDAALNANIPVEMVNGNNKGIQHSFRIKQDLFATGNTALVNHKTYFYTVVSYAYNNYKTYDQNDPLAIDGQKKPYLAGRNNVKTYSAIPHHHAPEYNGQVLNSTFGQSTLITRIEGQGNGGNVLDFTKETIDQILTPPYRAVKATYLPGKSPVTVQVYDPVKVASGDFSLRFDGITDNSKYTLLNKTAQLLVPSDYPISRSNPQIYPEWGISTNVTPTFEPGDVQDPNNGFLEATIDFSDSKNVWLTGMKDNDNPAFPEENWIRSGTDATIDYIGLDDNEVYENVINGTWAPYKLTSKSPVSGPKWSSLPEALISLSPFGLSNTSIASIDLVITSDKSKWSRVAIVETGFDQSSTENNAKQYDLRSSPSIGKNGEPDNSVNPTGMGWFPGYAYNVETGERLNIVFGENSSLTGANGRDMKFNPTANIYDSNGGLELGGMHYLYILGHYGDDVNDMPMYDSCRHFSQMINTGVTIDKRYAWRSAMYCNIPLTIEPFDSYNLPDEIPSDVKIRIRVKRNYKTYTPATVVKNTQSLNTGTTYYVVSAPVIHDGTTYTDVGSSFVATASSFTGAGSVTDELPKNSFNPLYEFGTQQLSPTQFDQNTAQDALKMINVVPNPYYAFSAYEQNQLDNRIKFVNLPSKCTISIFTQNGTLVRKFKRDAPVDNSEGAVSGLVNNNAETSVDWDLKNFSGIPVASGVYLIHVDAGVLGQRTLKWFGMLRPIDLDTF